MWLIGSAVVRALAPILSFTAEECWGFLPKHKSKEESVFLSVFPKLGEWRDSKVEETFSGIWAVRDVVLKALEDARAAKVIGHPREAKVALTVDAVGEKALKSTREDLSRLFLVSELEVKPGGAISAAVSRAAGEKCARCWTYSTLVGKSAKYPDLCDRCAGALDGPIG
jgi:isoleucyl-tRNA synthetase